VLGSCYHGCGQAVSFYVGYCNDAGFTLPADSQSPASPTVTPRSKFRRWLDHKPGDQLCHKFSSRGYNLGQGRSNSCSQNFVPEPPRIFLSCFGGSNSTDPNVSQWSFEATADAFLVTNISQCMLRAITCQLWGQLERVFGLERRIIGFGLLERSLLKYI
jgi:hypothetical protein